MGQKTHPKGFRLGVSRTWDSRWYADGKDYVRQIREDKRIREFLREKLQPAGIARIEIQRVAAKVIVDIHAARPGLVIGKKGAGIEGLRNELIAELKNNDVTLNIKEVRKPELEADLVSESIVAQLEKRVAFRRAMKKAVQSSLKVGARGVKVQCAGRLAGAEIARTEWYREGRVPLHTLRADVDYGIKTAKTTYGVIGVKTWIYRGDAV